MPKTQDEFNDILIEILSKNNQPLTQATLKKAYHAQALLVHPDQGGDTEAFKALNRAYELLQEKVDDKPTRVASPTQLLKVVTTSYRNKKEEVESLISERMGEIGAIVSDIKANKQIKPRTKELRLSHVNLARDKEQHEDDLNLLRKQAYRLSIFAFMLEIDKALDAYEEDERYFMLSHISLLLELLKIACWTSFNGTAFLANHFFGASTHINAGAESKNDGAEERLAFTGSSF